MWEEIGLTCICFAKDICPYKNFKQPELQGHTIVYQWNVTIASECIVESLIALVPQQIQNTTSIDTISDTVGGSLNLLPCI